jgi:predicted DNA-binding protein
MPNPKGNPESLEPFTTSRDEPLVKQISLRVSESMHIRLKSLENYPEFVRQAIAKALRELEDKE